MIFRPNLHRAHRALLPAGTRRWALVAVFTAVGTILCACNRHVRRFPLYSPVTWDEPADRRPFAEKPQEYFSPFWWDGANQMVFRPLTRLLAVDIKQEAINVNAMDEVPDSSWYVNRLSRRQISTERLMRAACEGEPLNPDEPWSIVAAKPNGANPGFIIEDPHGRKFLLKFDSPEQPERATAADVMGSILYWGAGYHTPCNRVVFFDRDNLRIPEGTMAEIRTANEVIREPLTWKLLEPIFEKQAPMRLPDGRYRAASSAFVPGQPIGPWRYESTWEADPNDVVPHEHRRELRGNYVLSSWINHFDSREQNTLAVWMSTTDSGDPKGRAKNLGYVRHYYIDFGDCFGSKWAIEGIARRLGHSSYFDLPHIGADFITLGLLPRPWHHARNGPAGERLGYYDVRRFEADAWRPGYPNPSFLAATERDKAWMARIVARFRPEDIRALVEHARIQHEPMRRELFRIVLGRRNRILRRWFRTLSPLTAPRIARASKGDGRLLCMTDLALTTGIIASRDRPYLTRAWQHTRSGELRPLERGDLVRRGADEVCVALPEVHAGQPEYLVVDLIGLYSLDDEQAMPARVHLYQTAHDQYLIAGLERPYSRAEPGEGR